MTIAAALNAKRVCETFALRTKEFYILRFNGEYRRLVILGVRVTVRVRVIASERTRKIRRRRRRGWSWVYHGPGSLLCYYIFFSRKLMPNR